MRLKTWIFMVLAGLSLFTFMAWRFAYQDKVLRNQIGGTVIARTVDGEVIVRYPDGSMTKEKRW